MTAEATIESVSLRLKRMEGQTKTLRFITAGAVILAAAGFSMPLLKGSGANTKIVTAESFLVRNANGDTVVLLGTTPEGTPNLAFFDAERNVRMVLGLRPNGGPSLSLADPEHAPRAVLSLNDQQEPSLTLFNADKLQRAVFSIDTSGSGHAVLYGIAGGLNLSSFDGKVQWNPIGGSPQDIPVQK